MPRQQKKTRRKHTFNLNLPNFNLNLPSKSINRYKRKQTRKHKMKGG